MHKSTVEDNLNELSNPSTGDSFMHYLVQLNNLDGIHEMLTLYGVDVFINYFMNSSFKLSRRECIISIM